MRVIGHIDNTPFKVTVFKMDLRFTVKFEAGMYELAYRFPVTEQINGLAAIQALITPSFVEGVQRQFADMHQTALQALATSRQASHADEFETII